MTGLAESNFIAVDAKTWLVVASVEAGYADNDEIVGDASGAEQFVLIASTGPKIQYRNWDGNYDTSTGVSFTQSTPLVYTAKHQSGNLYDAKNGVAWTAAVASGDTTTTTRLQVIGARATNYAPLKLYSIVVANVVISDADLTAVINYFKSQIGI